MASLSSSTKAAACRTRPKKRTQQEEAENLIPAGFLADWRTDPPRRPFKSLLCGAHAPHHQALSVSLSVFLSGYFFIAISLSLCRSLHQFLLSVWEMLSLYKLRHLLFRSMTQLSDRTVKRTLLWVFLWHFNSFSGLWLQLHKSEFYNGCDTTRWRLQLQCTLRLSGIKFTLYL